MIIGLHAVVFASDAPRARAFFSDVLGLPHVDAGDGWLIFRSPPAELAFHPAAPDAAGAHELYLMCDDLAATMAELTAKGVEFTSVVEAGFGRLTHLMIPGCGRLALYQPRHPVAYDL
ncbi:VOC family protein [Pseudonocardia sp. CA-107938]|uniref:VOC family protein n=1 Tax=Pseudonocardia sp. CA-107938 TaxID=3240021 RepID=UPI003D8AB433